jgi:hypothetical protein
MNPSFRNPLAAFAALAGLALAAGVAQAATPTHVYLLDSDGHDELGGPDIVGEGGSFGVSALGQLGYQFAANQGLVLTNVLPVSVYTIDFSVSLDLVDGWRKYIDFKGLSSDAGLYNYYQTLNFFPIGGGTQVLNVGELARVTLTRDASGTVVGYVNGSAQISFDDSVVQLATFTEAQQLGRLFHDDFATGEGEASSGFVDYVRIYDVALTADEVAALTSPVPEPAVWALMLAGGMFVARRRPQR